MNQASSRNPLPLTLKTPHLLVPGLPQSDHVGGLFHSRGHHAAGSKSAQLVLHFFEGSQKAKRYPSLVFVLASGSTTDP